MGWVKGSDQNHPECLMFPLKTKKKHSLNEYIHECSTTDFTIVFTRWWALIL